MICWMPREMIVGQPFIFSFSTLNDKRIHHFFSNFFFSAKLDRANARHDYPFKRRKDSDNSILSAINQPDAFNVPHGTQLQQGEERETNISAEEENHDRLDAQGNDSRTTGKNFYVLEFLAAFYLSLRNHNMFCAYVFYGHLCEVNNFSQPDNSEARKLSSFIGVLTRDPRIMPIDCIDFRKIGEDRVEHIWNIVQPRQWFRETLAPSWRWNKCKLKREKFNGKSVDEGLKSRPTIIPKDQWRNATKDGKEPDKLELFEATHKPKRPETKLDDASTAVLSQLRRGEYGRIEDEEADRSFWQEFEKDFPLYKQAHLQVKMNLSDDEYT
ncbi:hypothetical protein Cgig2_017170 [Carnegiea gigantea]|uniref:Uncharacterized protein n=1 Tax=Carnegiea gigantea TaxID=171969 RepID=A0A9Q1QEP1_9CARY|nr:hypothetical protein Cgig2_017170 [Carnegiea gigantea]